MDEKPPMSQNAKKFIAGGIFLHYNTPITILSIKN